MIPAFLWLLVAVIAIVTLTLMLQNVTSGPKYCPNSLSLMDKNKIDQCKNCEDFRSNQNLYEYCVNYKNCIECPSHGICQDGKFTSCESGFVKEGGRCVENAEI